MKLMKLKTRRKFDPSNDFLINFYEDLRIESTFRSVSSSVSYGEEEKKRRREEKKRTGRAKRCVHQETSTFLSAGYNDYQRRKLWLFHCLSTITDVSSPRHEAPTCKILNNTEDDVS
ncbi:uncharacterized protein LOC122634277 [Vespula pensylvanica]|uniref:uncharacterized protein LOC122634277 n=1 Tax=Vespula pensylvanica TaxID=30213 RepID=UPI001CBA222C|nr:uncharacterized protein LOC122634277 [Vespula pensylvanica]